MLSRFLQSLLFAFLLCLLSINTALASEQCDGAGITTSILQINGANAAKIEDVIQGCDADKQGLKVGDVIVSINGNAPDVKNVNALLGNVLTSYAVYTINIDAVDGGQKTITNLKPVEPEVELKSVESEVETANPPQVAEPELFIENKVADMSLSSIQPEAPIYKQANEIGADGVKWIKWFIFFLALTLFVTPSVFKFFRIARGWHTKYCS